jgi:hypothetical protein
MGKTPFDLGPFRALGVEVGPAADVVEDGGLEAIRDEVDVQALILLAAATGSS